MTDLAKQSTGIKMSIQDALRAKSRSRNTSESEGKWATLNFQSEVVPKKLTIGEMGRRHIEKKLQEAEQMPKVYEKVTEEKINRLIVDYNSDVSASDAEDEDRSRFHKKKRRKKTDQQTLVEGESLTAKVDEFLKRFEPKEEEIVLGKGLFKEEPKEQMVRSESQESLASGDRVLFGDWRACKDSDGDVYYWNVNTDETTWDKPKKPEVVVQSCYTQVSENDINPSAFSKQQISDLCRQNLDKLNALINESPSYLYTPQLSRQIELKTRYVDWRSGQLSNQYFLQHVRELERDLSSYEQKILAPPGWQVHWDKELKSYQYYNRVTEERQAYYPEEKIPALEAQKVIQLD